jgi:hypothetical protein
MGKEGERRGRGYGGRGQRIYLIYIIYMYSIIHIAFKRKIDLFGVIL